MITDTLKGGGTVADIGAYAQYMVSAKDHPDAKKGERVLLVQSDNMLTGPVPAPNKRKACKAFASGIAQKIKNWTKQARGGKPPPKSLFQSGSISFSEEDSKKLTPAQALEITRKAVQQVMPGDRPALYAVHGDSTCLHVHFLVSSVDSHGKIWNPRFDFRLWEAAMERLEIEHGLERVTQRKAVAKADPVREIEVKAPTRAELEIAARTGEASPKALALEILDAARQNATTIPEFFDQVEAVPGYEIVPNGTQGKCSGYSLRCPDGIQIKGSDFGRKYSFTGLQKGGIEYVEDRDAQAISRRREREHERAFGGSNDPINNESATRQPSGRDTPSITPSFDGNRSDRGPNGGSSTASSSSRATDSASASTPRSGLGASSKERTSPEPSGTSDISSRGRHPIGNHHDGRDVDSASTQNGPGKNRGSDHQGSPTAANPAIERQLISWDRQCRALGFSNATEIRVMLIDRDPRRCTVSNPVGAGGMLHPDPAGGKFGFQRKSWRQEHGEIRWTPDQVRNAITSGRLAGLNNRGFDVFMRPYEDHYHYLFVDDTTPETLKNAGYHPCLIQESSAGNFQCVLKVPRKNHAPGSDAAKLEKRAANALALSINDRHGDRQAGRIDQVFRVAGFSNKKPTRNNEFTKVDWGRCIPGAVCLTAANELDDMRDAVRLAAVQKHEDVEPEDMRKQAPQQEPEEVRAHAEHARFDRKTLPLTTPENPEDVQYMAREIRRFAKIRGRGKVPNWSEVDFLACRELAKQGWSADRLSNALYATSPALSDRKKGHEEDYVQRTVKAAIKATIITGDGGTGGSTVITGIGTGGPGM